jgi:hypothetical protein
LQNNYKPVNIEKDLKACEKLLERLKLNNIPIELLQSSLAAEYSLKTVVKMIINREFIK